MPTIRIVDDHPHIRELGLTFVKKSGGCSGLALPERITAFPSFAPRAPKWLSS
ncbi:hypothetical protein ALPO108162_10645 [Alicyclobacillus pomorum]